MGTALLAELLDNAPYGIVAYEAVRDADGQILDYRTVYHNPQALVITGHTARQMTDQLLFQRAPHARIQAGALRRVVDDHIPYDVQELMPVDRRWFMFENRPLTGGYFTIIRDIDDLKRAEEQLAGQNELLRHAANQADQQQRLLQSVLDASPGSLTVERAIRDESGAIIDFQAILVNPAALALGGHTEEDVLNRRISDLNPAFKVSGLMAAYQTVLATGELFRRDFFHPPLAKFLDVSVTRLDDEHVTVLFSDITRAKQAAEQTESQARLFGGVLDSITSGLSVLEAIRDNTGAVIDVRYVRVSRAILTDTGLTEPELLGQGMLTLFPGVKQTAYWPSYMAVLETGEPQHFEVHYHYDGFDNYTDNWVTRIDNDRIISIYTVINDYKRATLALEQQAGQTASVLNGAINGILLLEADPADATQEFIIRQANQASATLLGLSVESMVDRPMSDVFPHYRRFGFHALYVSALTTGHQRAELDYADGPESQNVTYDISAVKQGENGIVLTFMDISDQKHLRQQQERLLAELKNSNASLEQFAYVASHDLQEPLRKIQSFGDMLLAEHGDVLPDDGRDMLRRMQAAAGRMNVLIRDLLAYSRLSMQQEPFVPVDLNDSIGGIRTDLELVITEKNARIVLAPLPTVSGNAVQLRQLFQNLLTNALKFTRPGIAPQVSLSVRPVLPDDVPARVPNRRSQEWIAIDVADNGIGFDEQYQERIFQLFERLHGRNEYAGTGIGLSVCQKVAGNHGGTITAHSRLAEGTTFTVYLPYKS